LCFSSKSEARSRLLPMFGPLQHFQRRGARFRCIIFQSGPDEVRDLRPGGVADFLHGARLQRQPFVDDGIDDPMLLRFGGLLFFQRINSEKFSRVMICGSMEQRVRYCILFTLDRPEALHL
jgi:hypothetical protein